MTDDELTLHLAGLERSLISQAVRSDAARIAALLDDSFFEFGVSGTRWDKRSTIDALPREPFVERVLDRFELVRLSPDIALLTYRGRRFATTEQPVRDSLRSSIWKRFGDDWRLMFHQGTSL